jgi:FMN-dependent oxidoreductase (nitrilotriacetate monooxygenase family)
MSSSRELHLNLNFLNAGTFGSAWRWPDSDPKAFADVEYYVRVAQLAERGTFDAIFLADHPGLSDQPEYRPFNSLEPTIVLATVAAHTRHIGLIATASTSYNDPYNIARRFASLDHASGGRVGLNLVTTADRQAAQNFGLSEVPSHGVRYARALEFAEVVEALWDSWQDDAFVGDKDSARFVDVSRVHAIDYAGKHFTVRGPLNVPRPPQGRPVVVQAGGSADGRELAARHADAVFSLAQTPDDALAYASTLRGRAEELGRSPDSILIFPGLVTVIGGTEAEAKRREQELWELVPIEYGLGRLANLLQVDRSVLKLDEPLPDGLDVPADGMQTFAQGAMALARREKLTVRQLVRAQGGGTNHRIIVGTPEQIADEIERWYQTGAADGFNVMPDVLPSGLEAFVDQVVPLLRRRGIFRSEYRGGTLRDHFGLARPARGGVRPSVQGEAKAILKILGCQTGK